MTDSIQSRMSWIALAASFGGNADSTSLTPLSSASG